MDNLRKAATELRAATEHREKLQERLGDLEAAIEKGAGARDELKTAERDRKSEIGSARLDGRTADTSAIDKRLRKLRAAVDDLDTKPRDAYDALNQLALRVENKG